MASFIMGVSDRDNFYIKIGLQGVNTWMCIIPGGDGELESGSQGRSRDSSFAQETGEKIQSRSRIDSVPGLLGFVQDAQRCLTHLPSFFFTSECCEHN